MRLVTTSNGYWALISVSVLLVIVALVCALLFGAVTISINDLLTGQQNALTIVQSLRLPRAILALEIGVILAVCGCLAQGLFRNPLADPSLIGVSAGASLGAGVAIVFLQGVVAPWLSLSVVSLAAFIGSTVVVFSVYQIAGGAAASARGTSLATLLLAGIAFTFFAGSVANFLEFISDDHRLRQLSLWRMGGLDGASNNKALLALVVGGLVCFIGWTRAKPLDALLLGESEARYLGVSVHRLKTQLIVIIAFGVGVSVALAGTITFVGLVVPHMARAIVGPGHARLIPFSALIGALLLLSADTVSRIVMAPTELPVGLITSLIGAPLFILLLKKQYAFRGAV